jgi:DNA-binding beta-propeller fold protein YncE
MQAPRGLAFNRDGTNLYVSAQKTQAGNKDGTIAVFDRNTTSGELTFKQSLKYNDPLVTVPVVQRMPNAEELVVSPDGNFVYVSGGSGDAIVIFARAGDGTLTYLGYQNAGGLKNALGITISTDPAGKYVFATGSDDNAVNVYTRDATTGQLLLIDSRTDADAPVCVGGGNAGAACKKNSECPGGLCDFRPELFNAEGVALSMDQKQLYVTSRFKGSITIFENDICGNGTVGTDEECDGGSNCTAECKLDVCAPAPIPCRTPTVAQQSSLTIKNNALNPDTKDSLQWKWKKGAATTDADYGDPTSPTGATYVLCVYDNTGLMMSRAAPRSGVCDKGKPCWKSTISGGALKKYTYQDKLLTPVGLSDVQLTVGVAGKAQISVKGKGSFLTPPALPFALPVTVQLVNTQTSACWGATFATTTSAPTDPAKLTAKGQ